jgi:uncharacterized protein YifN (PemK superfamily)
MSEPKKPAPILPERDAMRPVPGDVISARYRWLGKAEEEDDSKIRPCVVIYAPEDGSSMTVVPISTRPSWDKNEHIQIPDDERAMGGFHSEKQSYAKIKEVNRFKLPNLAVIPHVGEDGRMSWTRGRVSDEVFKKITTEVDWRKAEGSLRGNVVEADTGAFMKIAAIKKISPQSDSSETREERIQRRAADAVKKEKPVLRPRTTDIEAPQPEL